jgi:tetratricopeptide (TPR) repeat protein
MMGEDTMRWVLLIVASVIAASPVAAIDDQQSCLKSNAEDARIEACSRALQAKPDDAIAYYNRGATYQLKGDFDRAIADFSKAVELKPDYAAAYDARGLVYVAKGDYVHALSDVTRANELATKRAKKQATATTKKAAQRPQPKVIAKASPPGNAASTDQLPKWAPLDQAFQ